MRLVLFLFVLFCQQSIAQFSGSNLLEYSYGKLPDENEKSFHGVYSKPILNYRWDNIKAVVGLQAYQSPYSERNYVDVSWLGVNYKNKHWDISVGNYNSTLERGILLRSYEIQGALLEDLSFRGKHYFYRDLLGASVGYKRKGFSLKALWGYALNGVFPPTRSFKERRSDEIAAISTQFKLLNHHVGVSSIRVKNEQEESYYGSGNLSGTLIPNVSYYSSYALSLNNEKAYALYSSLNYSTASFGISLELKDYSNFLLGSGLNEPPALVREHSYRVLNRTTHVLQPENETGFQIEAFYSPNLNTTVILNYTQAKNGTGKTFNYQEWFAELNTSFTEKTDVGLFLDYAQDPLKNQQDRISAGFTVLHELNSKSFQSIGLEFNSQAFKRADKTMTNYVGDLSLYIKSKIVVNVLSEWSTDSFFTDSSRIWFGSTVHYKMNSKNKFALFAGERRGGPACNAGVCYEILDFKGVELRWVARF